MHKLSESEEEEMIQSAITTLILAITFGVHTYSAGMVLTYKQYKKIWNACYNTGCIEETSDIWTNEEGLMEYLRIARKSLMPTAYNRVLFKKDDGKTKDYKTSNAHSYCVSCDRASFLVYDKIAQLKMIERCNDALLGKNTLRFEAELKRPALKDRLGKSAMETNYKLLSTAAKSSGKAVGWYLKRLQPKCDRYLRYEDAVELIEGAKLSKKSRERMLYLLRKTSDKDSLSAALDDMRKKFGLKKGQCNTVLKKFRKLGISPITLANNSKFKELPTLTDL